LGIVLGLSCLVLIVNADLTSLADFTSGRVFLWVKSVEILKNSPLTGIGFNNFLWHIRSLDEFNIEFLGLYSSLPAFDLVNESSYYLSEHNFIISFLNNFGLILGGYILYKFIYPIINPKKYKSRFASGPIFFFILFIFSSSGTFAYHLFWSFLFLNDSRDYAV